MAAVQRVSYLNYSAPPQQGINVAPVPAAYEEYQAQRVVAPLNISETVLSKGVSWNGVIFTPKLMRECDPVVGDLIITFTDIDFYRTRHEAIKSYFNANITTAPSIGARLVRDAAAGLGKASCMQAVGLLDLISRWNSSLDEYHSMLKDIGVANPSCDDLRALMFNRAIAQGPSVSESSLWMLMHSVIHSPEEVTKFLLPKGCLYDVNMFTKMSTIYTSGSVTLTEKYSTLQCGATEKNQPGLMMYMVAYRPRTKPAAVSAEFCGTKLGLFCATSEEEALAVIDEMITQNPDDMKTFSFIQLGTTVTSNCQTLMLNSHARWYSGNMRVDTRSVITETYNQLTENDFGEGLPSNRITDLRIARGVNPIQ